jgi:AICAR transformylase/IMP cyclohydrolase PurH
MRFEYAGRTVKEALEATDEDWPDRTSAEVACDAFMPVEDAIVIRDQAENGGKVIFGADERNILVVLSR